jgi:glucose/arabinose dehydrogenase
MPVYIIKKLYTYDVALNVVTCLIVIGLWILIFILGCNPHNLYAAKFKDSRFEAQLLIKGLASPTGMVFTGENDILVTEKQGIVQRVIGSKISSHPVLDIREIVNSTGERGLLSIGISHPSDVKKNYNDDNAAVVYLLFTTYSGKNISNSNSVIQKSETLQNATNSIYRYKLQEGELTHPKLLANVYLYSNESIQHIGGKLKVGPDDKIYFTTGDGRGCEYFEDCSTKTAYFTNNTHSKLTGGIYYLTDNMETDDVNETNSSEYHQYAYGIRNSFGLDFDPETGNLWDTENGPSFGDEINLVKSGFNSGWAKFQGVWSVTNYSQIFNNPPPGLPKGYYFTDIEQSPTDINRTGKYSNPKLTWNQTVGVTSIKFFDSDKYGKQYQNDIFVSTYKGGLIYHFDLDKARDQLLLRGPLNDTVSNSSKEMDDVIFAQGLVPGGISDLEVGPDGYLYVLTLGSEGAIYKIVPK